MSKPAAERDNDSARKIRLVGSEEGWVATDVDAGVTTQGESREAALRNLDEAVALRRGEVGREPTNEELREAGIDPADNETGSQSPPDILDGAE